MELATPSRDLTLRASASTVAFPGFMAAYGGGGSATPSEAAAAGEGEAEGRAEGGADGGAEEAGQVCWACGPWAALRGCACLA